MGEKKEDAKTFAEVKNLAANLILEKMNSGANSMHDIHRTHEIYSISVAVIF